jgi:hypothetical protein
MHLSDFASRQDITKIMYCSFLMLAEETNADKQKQDYFTIQQRAGVNNDNG